MKRFLFISIFLHAVVLVLLFSWEIPLANRLLPRSVVEVSIIERIEGKPEGKKEGGDQKQEKKSIQKENIPEKKEVGATRRVAGAQEEFKIQERNRRRSIPSRKKPGMKNPSRKRRLRPSPPF